ncbi:MAG: Glycerol-3-phosphate dehydrogenase [Anaerolineae bacterium]|jgi:glycerol-3-phosphate dehydrogenase|nr:MAG: Glycerol-3-phosphate dehydrogenase [Anaerolineae bacterium]
MMRHHPIDANQLSQKWDVIVVGGGINGSAIARDAALRGLKVLVLEKEDISSGTSAWSTRLIHGGLRYLEYFEFYLVRESLAERERLLRNAPHLVKPLGMAFPFYKQNRRPAWMIRMGMILYDVLSYDKSLDHHHILSPQQVFEQVGALNPEGLSGAAMYYDCQVAYAERLSVENILSAKEQGATFLNYARVKRFILDGNRVCGVEFEDLLEQKTYSVSADLVVNVGGPWVDEVLKGVGKPLKRLIGGTKGSHLVVPVFPGAPKIAVYFEARADGRPMFVIPWTGRILIGTTDLPYQGDLDHVEIDDEEITYLMNETNGIFPSAQINLDKILYTYSGIRPLPYVGEKKTAAITRRHIIHDHTPEVEGLISIIGGKLTTFRNLAEQCVDLIGKKLNRPLKPCVTNKVHLPGAGEGNFVEFQNQFIAKSGFERDIASHLTEIYGARAEKILALIQKEPKLKERLHPGDTTIGAEVIFAFEEEQAETIQDVLLRRCMGGYNDSAGLNILDPAIQIAGDYFGWDKERREQEKEAYQKYIQRYRPKLLRQP